MCVPHWEGVRLIPNPWRQLYRRYPNTFSMPPKNHWNILYTMKELVVLEEGGFLNESETTDWRCMCASCVRYNTCKYSHRRLLYWGILLPLLWVINIASLGYCLYGLAHKETSTEACSRDDFIAIISNHRQARNQMRQWLSYCGYALFLYASTVCMLWMVTKIS